MTLSLRFRPVFAILALLTVATPAAAQSISMTADRSSAVEGQTVTLRAVVTTLAGEPVTQGHIYFTGSGGVSDVLGFQAPDATGRATFSTNSLAIGRHEIVARYKPTNSTVLNNNMPKSNTAHITIVRSVAFGALTMPMPVTDPCVGTPVLADFNNDGLLDHAAACSELPAIHVRMGNGDGTFQPATVLATAANRQWDLVAADFDDDGRKDIVVLGTTSSSQATLTYLDNLGGGDFAAPIVSNFTDFIYYDGRLALINADGTRVPDVVMSSTNGVSIANIGAGRIFTQRFALPYIGEVTAVATGDINGDGYDDMAVSLVGDTDWVHKLFVYKGNGTTSGFTLTTNGIPVPMDQQMVNGLVIEDFTGNGRGDVVSSHGRFWTGLADGSLGAAVEIPNLHGSAIVAGEFTGDGVLDVMGTGQLLAGQPGGFTFTAIPVPIDLRVAIDDIDNDGRLDAAFNWAVMLARDATSMTMTIEGAPAPGDAFTIRADVVGATAGTVAFASEYGALGTAIVDEQGVATLAPFAWAPPGLKTVTATFSGDATYGRATASGTFTIVKAPSEMFIYVSPERPGHNAPFVLQAGVSIHGPSVPSGGNMVVTIDNQAPVQHSVSHAFLDLTLALPSGSHTITVAYTGDSVYLPGSITTTFEVGQVATQTHLTSNAPSVQHGSQFQLTASVTSSSSTLLTGSVTFLDGDAVMGTVPVDGTNPAIWTTSAQTPGLHLYRAIYEPNQAIFAASESSIVAVSVMLPGGGLRRPISAPTAGANGVVRLGDLNHDGKLDAVAVQGAVLSVFLGNGDLTVQPRADMALPANALTFELRDDSGDGHLDAIVFFETSGAPIAVRTLYGNGAGAFTAYHDWQLPGTYGLPTAVARGDFTGDGHLDFAIADGTVLSTFSNSRALLGTINLGIHPSSLVLTDLNRDGRADLVASQWQAQTQLVMLSDGAGGFSAPVWTGANSADPALYDFDTDGIRDLIAVKDQVTMFRGNGDGTFQGGVVVGPAPGASPAIGDLNNDSVLDIVTIGDALHVMSGAAPIVMTASSDREHLVDPGVPVTITVTLAAKNAADGVPVGPIRFRATSVSVDAQDEWSEDVTPVNGVATFTRTYPYGFLDITVDYDGDATFGAASALFSHFVLYAPPPENTAPVLTLPANIVVEADRRGGALVTYVATAFDAEDGALTITCARASGRKFPIGTTTVTCRAKDSENLLTTGTFTVTVVDTTAPVVTFKNNREPYEAHQNVNIRCVAKDVASEIAATTCVDTVAPAYTFPLGVTTISATATDASGNVGTASTTFTVVTSITAVKNLVRDFSTNDVVTKELIQKLNRNQLPAFRTQVQAQSGLAFTAEQAGHLLRLATGL